MGVEQVGEGIVGETKGMGSLSEDIREYNRQLKAGSIQRAYRGIMSFMSGLRDMMASNHPDFSAGSLYQGYMDMTYFSFTPAFLSERKLKIAVGYLHEEDRLEVWLAGINRRIQAECIELMKGRDLGGYKLSRIAPGIDSIVEAVIAEEPDFHDIVGLSREAEAEIVRFSAKMEGILRESCNDR